MEPNRDSSFRLRILSIIIIFSVLPTLFLGAALHHKFRSAYKRKLAGSLINLVQHTRDTVEFVVEERIQDLLALFSTLSPDSFQDEASLEKLLIALKAGSDSFVDLEAIDGTGNRRAYSGPDRHGKIPASYAGEQWFRNVTSSGVSVSDVFLKREHVPCVFIAVRGTVGQEPWTLRASMRTTSLENVLRLLQPGDSDDVYLISRTNVLQTTPKFSGALLGHPSGPDLSSSLGSCVEEIDDGTCRNLFATASFQNPSWVLVLREGLEEGVVGFADGFRGQVLLLGGIGIVLLFGAIVLVRSLTNGLSRVNQITAESVRTSRQADMIRALGRMAAGIAHEVNNPLAIMSGHAGWMKDLLDEEDMKGSSNFPQYMNCLDKIQSQVDRCKTVTQRLLNFGRSMGKDRETVEINQLLASTLTFFSSEAYFRDIEIRANYADAVPPVETDPRRIQQVFLETIDQAIEWIGKIGTIEVKTDYSASSDGIVIEVSCTRSMEPRPGEDKAEASFSRAKVSGFSVSRNIIEKQGGRMVGTMRTGGLTLTIQLPVR